MEGISLISSSQYASAPRPLNNKGLSDEDQKKVQELKRRDTEVRNHEMAHMAAGSGIVRGGANYEYEKGPDGKSYAVGGEVSIDTSEEKDPRSTIAKMQKVRAAALAPANPSAQDRQVAAEASSKMAQASVEQSKESKDKGKGPESNPGLNISIYA